MDEDLSLITGEVYLASDRRIVFTISGISSLIFWLTVVFKIHQHLLLEVPREYY